jgi:hypothetical protein
VSEKGTNPFPEADIIIASKICPTSSSSITPSCYNEAPKYYYHLSYTIHLLEIAIKHSDNLKDLLHSENQSFFHVQNCILNFFFFSFGGTK